MLASELPQWFVRLFAFAFGAVWGSFANVVIYRWPRELSVVRPASHCFACKHPIAGYDNVPIFAYLWLRGRCRHCGARFSPRYAIVELMYAVISTAIAERPFYDAGPVEPRWALAHWVVRFTVAFTLLTASFIDLDEMIVPWFVKWVAVVPLAGALLLPAAPPTVDIVQAIAGAAMGYLGMRVLFIDGYRVLTGRRGMGLGDAEILLVVGALLGPAGVLFALGAGAVQGVIATAVVTLLGGRIGPAHADEVEDDDEEAPVTGTEPDSTTGSADRVETATADAPVLTASEAGPAPGGDDRPVGAEETPRAPGPMKVPFVPFLALAALEYLLGADALVQAYLRFLRGE
ncbi:MAG: prepilin peptidase [Deltaproteobacteria bacterium]